MSCARRNKSREAVHDHNISAGAAGGAGTASAGGTPRLWEPPLVWMPHAWMPAIKNRSRTIKRLRCFIGGFIRIGKTAVSVVINW